MISVLALYNHIPLADRKLFAAKTRSFVKSKGDYLLFDGDIQDELYLVKSGVAFLSDETGAKVRVIDFAYNNRFCVDFGSFSNQTTSKYCIQCFSDCQLESISFKDLQIIFEKSQAIERAFRILLEKLFKSSLQKNRNERELNMEERFKLVMCEKPELFKLIPHKYIASYANIDVSNFSKLYNQFCINNGLIYK